MSADNPLMVHPITRDGIKNGLLQWLEHHDLVGFEEEFDSMDVPDGAMMRHSYTGTGTLTLKWVARQ